ncbi:MAG: hypothetical protein KGJ14_09375, partial [Nitrospirota bacterium]|nr:hypothetical protein [Nitrospirota bacterium]
MKRIFLLALLVVIALPAADAPAVIVDLKKDPSLAVKAYLSLDQKGARLDAMSWETLRPYINWTRELSWGIVVVIQDYEIIEDIKAWE